MSEKLESKLNPDAFGRLDVTIREASFEAGKISPVTILVRNPFDVPVEIVQIQGPRSYHLHEIEKVRSQDRKGKKEDLSKHTGEGLGKRGVGSRLKRFLGLGQLTITEISIGPISYQFPLDDRVLNIEAAPNSEVVVERELSDYRVINVEAAEGAKVHFIHEEPATGTEPSESEAKEGENLRTFTIEPHCESVAYFEISTTGWLFFTPTRQSLSTQIRYKINGREKTQVTTSEFEVKPPLAAMVIGAIIGAVLGSLAKNLNAGAQPLEWRPVAVAIGGSIVMSLIAAIALARKTGTQGFITVEDFFGGFVVGALIGYSGSEYFERAIVPADSPTLSVAPTSEG